MNKIKGTTGTTIFTSRWWTKKESGEVQAHSAIYRKPVIEGEVKGKLPRKWAKREKIRAMKHANHHKGNNTPFTWPDH